MLGLLKNPPPPPSPPSSSASKSTNDHPITMKPRPHKKRNKTQLLQTPTESSSAADFAFKITKIAVSQICQSLGFNATQLSALETLTHIATLYLQTIAKTAVSYSNASNRTQSNIFDTINSLHDMSAVQGFVGASTLHCDSSGISLLSSNVLKDVKFFVNFSDEIPFAKPIPRRNSIPLVSNSIPTELESRGLHIPKWLSKFPDESTYKKKCGEMGCDRRRGEELVVWENSKLVGGVGNGMEFQRISEENGNRRIGGGDLAIERGRVRFKIGGEEKVQNKGNVDFSYEFPFAKPIQRGNSIPLMENLIPKELESRGLHIPNWLPMFPDESTYKKCGEVERCKRKGEELELWECSKLVGGIGNANELQEVSEEYGRINCGAGGDLATERMRVRFKIGGTVNAQKRRKVNSCL